jgi:DNA-binding IclR family transcriptional regulator
MKRERGSTIQRVLDILDTVAASPKPISATEINEVLNLPKATAHRLCSELEARGYLLKKINGKSYVPGNRLHDVAVGVLANSRLRATRHAILTSLSEKVGETCNIAYADGLYMAYSDRVEQWQALPEHAAADQTQGGDRETTAGAPRQEYDYRSRNSDPGNR